MASMASILPTKSRCVVDGAIKSEFRIAANAVVRPCLAFAMEDSFLVGNRAHNSICVSFISAVVRYACYRTYKLFNSMYFSLCNAIKCVSFSERVTASSKMLQEHGRSMLQCKIVAA